VNAENAGAGSGTGGIGDGSGVGSGLGGSGSGSGMGLGRTSGPPAVAPGSRNISVSLQFRHVASQSSLTGRHSWQQRGDSGKSEHDRDYQSNDYYDPAGQQDDLAHQVGLHQIIAPHFSLLARQVFVP
jgi:hypothetical protein